MKKSLLEILTYRAQHQSDKQAYIFLQDGETHSASLTYGELHKKADSIASYLQSFKGERALLLYPSGLEFITAFFGCLYAGVIAVPVYPPRGNQKLSRLLSIVNDAEATVALTTTSILADIEKRWDYELELAQLKLVATDTIESNPKDFVQTEVTPDSLAFLQYTSGSTGMPKGVMVTHGNIIHNQQIIENAFGHNEKSIGVGWLPLFHDMGLIGHVLQPIFVGFPSILMPPVAFLQKPIRWLKAIAKYRATTSGGPNFAYDLCVKKIQSDDLANLDLSSWDLAFNGAEPLRAETLEQFSQKFAVCGFKYSAFFPCYGMAETTLFTTGINKNQSPIIEGVKATDLEQNLVVEAEILSPESRVFVGCGHPYMDTQCIIVNPESLTCCSSEEVGEIWVSSESVAAGYWNQPDATKETFQAYVKDTGEGPFLRTGDLGFLRNGELFVTGRLKDVIIIRGRNYYPQDIELTVEKSHPCLRSNCSAAFTVEIEAIERLVVVCEVERTHLRKLNIDEVVKEIQIAVLTEHELEVYEVVLLKTGSIPKTSSGKIQRRACKQKFLENSLNVVGKWQKTIEQNKQQYVTPRTENEEIIANIFSDVLGVENIGIYDNFFELGGHSLLATQLISRIGEAFSVEIPLRTLFESPTVAQLDQTIAQLPTFFDSESSVITLPKIVPTPEEKYQPFPLTDIQQAYWLGRNQNFDLGNIATHIYIELNCSSLNLARLNQAWQKLIEHHDMLRAVVLADGSQKILEKVPTYSIEVLDLRSSLPEEISSKLETIREQMSHEILPAEQWPLFKIRATILDEKYTRLHLSFDALVTDAWSMMLLGQQWQQLYENPQTLLSPLEISFRDYVVTELSLKNTPKYQQAQEYWFNRNLPPAPELPFALHPSSISKPTFKRHNARLEAQQWQQLKQRATLSNLTPSAVLLAAFADILNYWSKSPNFTINLTLFNRLPLHPEINQLVGDFTSVTLLEVDHSIISSFTARAQRLQQQLWQDLDHNYVSGVEVQRELRRVRGNIQSMGVVFTSTLGLNSLMEDTSSLNHLGEIVYAIGQTPQVWLEHQVFEQDGALVFNWDVVEELFPPGLIEDMFASYCNWLEQLANTDSAWSETHPQLLSPKQLFSIVAVNDNDTAVVEETLHGLFYKQVAAHSQFPAVISPNKTLTYDKLHQEATKLAQRLRQCGATPNTLVAVIMEKGWEQIVAVLGILISGAAYLPISPEFPQERQQYLIELGQVNLVLTQPQLEQSLSLPEDVKCLVVTEEELQSATLNLLESIQTPDDLAYVIYTSGSTGKPKGVMIDHKGVVNTILDINKRFGVGVNDRVLAISALEFDLSVYDIFGILAAGGAIVIPEPASCKRKDPSHWLELINAHQVTIWNTVPALMQMLVEHLSGRLDEQVGSLRLALLSGDWLPVNLPDKVSSLYSDIQVVSLGGATEASIWSIFYPIDKVESNWKSIPYGKPLDNQRFYVLNQLMQPTPTWVEGKLYIGGIGLAKGYWQNQEKTKTSFITHPLTQERLYKTGDLGRYLPSGDIEFLGREDFQVKINGFRIELGEIEAALKQHPAVKEAVVDSCNNKLVAYVVSQQKQLSSSQVAGDDESISTQMHEYLKQKLPDYMVPSAFLTLDTLPLTPNGKIDRKALPAPDIVERETEYLAPRTQSEEIIANIFSEVLNVENIGIDDNFFNLGGDSLLAVQLISRLRETFAIEIPLRELFSSPTVAFLNQTLTQLGDTKTIPGIQPSTETGELRLSWAQERLWFLNQLEGKSGTYNIPAAVRISGNLDIDALQQGLSEIVQRHEVLRTSFCDINGKAIQVIDPEATININLVDLQQLETTQRETLVLKQAQQEATTPFDLENAPLIRCSLLQLSASEYVLLLTMHHIVSDAWSMGVFIQELSSLYKAFIQGESSPLPQLPIQYADFAVWQRKYLSGEVLSTQLDYWKQQLHGAPDLLQLPTDFPRPTVQTYQGCTRRFNLNTDLTTKLQTLSRNSGTTLFMTLYAAFSTLLYRYSGQSDIVIGSPIANRNRSEIEGLIGFFVNTLVLRTNFEDNPSFKELLAQVRETTLKAIEHQDVPFEQVVEALQPQRSLSHSPLFQVMFVLQNAPMGDVELPGVTLSPIQLESTIAKFDLTLSITETSQGLLAEWEYNTDLFKSETIERMAAHFQNLLEAISPKGMRFAFSFAAAIAQNPLTNVRELNLLSESERHQLLVEWNNTVYYYPKDKCIHQLFEQQVEKTPLSIALVFEEKQLTYEQLNQRANQLAHHLQTLGVKPEVLVGICVERSIEMMVALLGILKAGGAYVPLDPNYPQERISLMLSDSGVGVLVTQNSLLESLPEHNARVVCLDSDQDEIEQQSKENLDAGVNSDNLAYVIYTSGSTGKPKGVQICHRGVVNFLNSMAHSPGLTIDDTLYAVTTISFDIAALELYLPLMVGAKVILGSREIASDGNRLLSELLDSKTTVMQATPATWQMLLTAGWSNDYPLKVLSGGEALSASLTNQILETGSQLWNMYGPTEATIWSTFYNIAVTPRDNSIASIGYPIANTQIYILDSHLQPVPIGVPGELYIGGDGLARGYLNRPQLTQEKFILNPFDKLKSQRLYKTGDLARYLPDGNLEFIARIDNQVKIRGFRIELGEIESALASHPQVNQAVVIALEENTGNKRLVAYVVLDELLTTQQLREFLKDKLPEYMVPSAFVSLDSLPLTPNGKIDRKALPALEIETPREQEYIAPRTTTEEIIAKTFSDVLGVENIGIHDNFFVLGGHSLLATQIIFSLRQTFQINLPVSCLFEEPTVARLAKTIHTILEKGTYTKTVLDLNAEAILDATIQPQSLFEYIQEPKAIFLTGATGFLGTYLLYQLLEQTTADIYCLVRSSDVKSAHIKLQNKLKSYLLWDDLFSSRIIPVVGDLSAKLLGLSIEQFNQLANKIDVIYHNGAWVNHIYNYLTLKPANVLGTEEILKLASEIKVKPLHFISTISVFSSEAYSDIELIRESDIPDGNLDVSNGYVQSKWVAEKLVMEARDRGLPVSIYRPALVTGHSQTGVSNTHDFFCRAVKGSVQLGMAPIIDYQLNLIPVDFVSQAIYEISRQKESLGKTFHLINSKPTIVKNLFQWVSSLDYPLEEVSLDQWISELIAHPENAFHPYAFNFKSQLESAQKSSNPQIDYQNTFNSLAATDLVIPPVDKKLLETYFSYFISHGFLNPAS